MYAYVTHFYIYPHLVARRYYFASLGLDRKVTLGLFQVFIFYPTESMTRLIILLCVAGQASLTPGAYREISVIHL